MKPESTNESLLQRKPQQTVIDTDDLVVEIIADAIRNMRRKQKKLLPLS